MLFDLKPKERLKDLFNRRDEYKELSRLIDSGLWVAVIGKRMTGKTSLVKTFAKHKGGVYVNLSGIRSLEDLVRKLMSESGLKFEEVGISLELFQVKWSKAAEDVFSRLRDRVIVLDEVQELSSPQFLRVLKSLWDTYGRLRIVFSGSYIGVLRSLLDPRPTSPLYGRTPSKLVLKTFTREASKGFLTTGFREHKHIKVNEEEIEEAVERLNGYVGWLAYYGNFRCLRKLPHEEALKETLKEGNKILLDELKNFLRNRRKDLYVKTLRMVSVGARWSEIKRRLDVNSKVLGDILETLTGAMLIDGKDGYYWIDDPIMREAVKLLK